MVRFHLIIFSFSSFLVKRYFLLHCAAPSRKFLKHGKEDKEHNSSKRKLQSIQDREESKIETASKEQHTSEMESAHPEPPSKKSKIEIVEDDGDGDDDEPILDLKKHSTKAHKWTDDEKKLFFEAVGKFGKNFTVNCLKYVFFPLQTNSAFNLLCKVKIGRRYLNM